MLSVPNLVTKSADIIQGPLEKSEIGRRSKLTRFHGKCDKVGDTPEEIGDRIAADSGLGLNPA